MGLGSNWGLTVSIEMKALRSFEKSALALEKGAERIASVGKSANSMISQLGENLSSRANNLNNVIKKLETTLASAQRLTGRTAGSGGGGGFGGGEFVFPKMNHARGGGKRAGRGAQNATDTFMREMFGIPKGLWDDFLPRGRNRSSPYGAFVGRMPSPQTRQSASGGRERYYRPEQFQSAILKATVTIPMVRAVEQLSKDLLQALQKITISYAGEARPAAATAPRRRSSADIMLDDSQTAAVSRGRGARAPTDVPTSVSYRRIPLPAEVRRRIIAPASGGGSVPELEHRYRQAVARALQLKSGSQSSYLANKFSDVGLSELPARLSQHLNLKPRQIAGRMGGFLQRSDTKQLLEMLSKTLTGSQGQDASAYSPQSLMGAFSQNTRGSALAGGGAASAVAMGSFIEKMKGYGAREMGAGSGSAAQIWKVLDLTYKLQYQKLWPLLRNWAKVQGADGSGSTSKARKIRRRPRGEGLGAQLDEPTDEDLQDGESNGARRPIWSFRSNAKSADKFRGALDRVVNWGSAAVVVYGGAQKIGEAIQQMTSFEAEINKVRKNINPLTADFYKLSGGAQALGVAFGQNINDIATAMGSYVKQGMDANRVLGETQTALLAVNTTDLDLTEAVEGLTAAQREFLLGTGNGMRVLDSWNGIGRISAVTANTLSEATKMAGTSARTSGVDFDIFNGIVAAVGETTRKSGETIGTSLKYIFQHVRDLKAVSSLQQIGVFSEDSLGNFKNAREILGQVARKWDTLSDAERTNVAINVAGTEHLNDFVVMMETWDRALDLSVVSMTSQGTTMKENAVIMQGLRQHVESLKAAFQGLFVEMGQSGMLDVLKTMADTAKNILQLFGGVNRMTGGLAGGILGTSALAVGGLGAASYFTGNVIGPAIFGRGSPEAAETGIAGVLGRKRNPNAGATSAISGAMAVGEDAAAAGGTHFWTPQRKTGAGLLIAGSLLTAGYNEYGKQALDGQAPTGRDTAVGIAGTALTTTGLLGTFGGSNLLKGGVAGKALFAAVAGAGLMQAYGQYKSYQQGADQNTPSGVSNRMQELEAWQDKISTTKGDVRTLIRQGAGDSHADIDVGKVQEVRDALAAIDPALESSAQSTEEFLKELREYPSRLDEISAKLRKQGSDIIGSMVAEQMKNPDLQNASAKITELEQTQRSQNLGGSIGDRRARVARASEISQYRDQLNDNLLQPFRARMLEGGLARSGMGNIDYGQLGNMLHMGKEDVAKVGLQNYLHGALGFSPNIDNQLNKAGVSPSGVKYFSDGPNVYDLATNQKVDKKTVGNSFVLSGTDSNAGNEVAMTQAKNLHQLVMQYQRSVDTLIAKNDDLLKSVDSINTTMTGMSLSNPSDLVGSKLDLQNAQRTLNMFNNVAQNGTSNFVAPKINDPMGVQNALIQLTGDVNQKLDSPYGASSTQLLSAYHAVRNTGTQALSGLTSAKNKLIASGGRVFDSNWLDANPGDMDSDEIQSVKYIHDTIGPDAVSQSSYLAGQIKHAQDSGDTSNVKNLSDQLDRVLSGGYKANTSKTEQNILDALRDMQGQKILRAQSTVGSLGSAFARDLSAGRVSNVNDFLATPQASDLAKSLNELTNESKQLVDIQQKNVQEIGSTDAGANSNEYKKEQSTLDILMAQWESLANISENLATRVHRVVVGMDELNTSILRVKSAAGYGAAFGQTGIAGDQYAITFLTKEISNLGDRLATTNDPSKQADINKLIHEYRNEIVRRGDITQTGQDYRGALGQGLSTNIIASRLQMAVGLPVQNAIGEWRDQTTAAYREMLQKIASDFGPALQGKGPEAAHELIEQIRPLLNQVGGKVHDLNLDADNDYRKQYLQASPGERLAADNVRNMIRQGASAEEIFSDPYTAAAGKNNPLFGHLMEQALDNQSENRAWEFQKDIAEYSKQTADTLDHIYASIINPARAGAGLASVAAPASPFATSGQDSSGSVDGLGRIKNDFTPAYLDKGEVVLDAKQSDDFIRRKNRFAGGTIPRNQKTRRALLSVPGTYTDESINAPMASVDRAAQQASDLIGGMPSTPAKIISGRVFVPQAIFDDMAAAKAGGISKFSQWAKLRSNTLSRYGAETMQRAWSYSGSGTGNMHMLASGKGFMNSVYEQQVSKVQGVNQMEDVLQSLRLMNNMPPSPMEIAARKVGARSWENWQHPEDEVIGKLIKQWEREPEQNWWSNFVAMGSGRIVDKVKPYELTPSLLKQAADEHIMLMYGSNFRTQSVLNPKGGALKGMGGLLGDAIEMGSKDSYTVGLSSQMFRDLLKTSDIRFGRIKGSTSRLADWHGIRLKAGGKLAAEDIIRIQGIGAGEGSSEAQSLLTLLRHESQHAIDQVWNPNLYEKAPKDIKALQATVAKKIITRHLLDESEEGLRAKRAAGHLYSNDLEAAALSKDPTKEGRVFTREVRALMAEEKTLSPQDAIVNGIFAKARAEALEHFSGGNTKKAWSVLGDGLRSANSVYDTAGMGNVVAFDRAAAMHGPNIKAAWEAASPKDLSLIKRVRGFAESPLRWVEGKTGAISGLGKFGARIADTQAGRIAGKVFRYGNPVVEALTSVDTAFDVDRLAIKYGVLGLSARTTRDSLKSLDVAESLAFSPISQPFGFAARQTANLLHYTTGGPGAGYTSDAQKEHDRMMAGKAVLAKEGVNTFSQWDSDYAEALKMKTAADQGASSRSIKDKLKMPLVLLASGGDFKSILKTGTGASGNGLQQRYQDVQDAIRRLEFSTGGYRGISQRTGMFPDSQASIAESTKRLAALRDQAKYLEGLMGGDYYKQNVAKMSDTISGIPDSTRSQLAASGAISALNQIQQQYGIKDDLSSAWGDAAATLVKIRPEATLLDLINGGNAANAITDPNKALALLMSKDPSTNALTGDSAKIRHLLNEDAAGASLNSITDKANFSDLAGAYSQIAARKANIKAYQNKVAWAGIQNDAPAVWALTKDKIAAASGWFSQKMNEADIDLSAKSKANADNSNLYLSRLGRRPELETRHLKDGNPAFGPLLAWQNVGVRLKGDSKWRYGSDAKAQSDEMSGLIKQYNARSSNSALPGGLLDSFVKRAGRGGSTSLDEMLGQLGGNSDFVSAFTDYADVQSKIQTIISQGGAGGRQLNDLTVKSNDIVANSRYLPQLFQKALLDEQKVAAIASDRQQRANAKAAVQKTEFDNRDTTPIFRARRHTGGTMMASNEYAIQDTEGLVLTGSRMEDAIGILTQIAKHSTSGDGMQSMAKMFMGHGPGDSNVHHSHGGEVQVRLDANDNFMERLASAVADKLSGNSGGAPMAGDRVKKRYEA